METKLIALKQKYISWRIELEERLKELEAKNLWDIYADREIHLRYVNQLIEDVDEILKK